MSHEALFIGLRQIGTSIAMHFARSDAELKLVGHDPDREYTRGAKELKIIDRFVSKPSKAAKSADIVILDVPAAAAPNHLELLAKQLKPDGIIIDSTPARSLTIKWVEKHLPADRHYLGITPIIGADILFSDAEEIGQPRIDLYQNGLLAIVVPESGSEEAVAAGLDLARLLGATPIFIDAHEHDGIATTVEWLPKLISAAILQEASEAGNWQEIQRMAGPTFATITSLWSEQPRADSTDLSSLNQDILRLKLQHFIGELQNLLHVLADESDAALDAYLTSAHAARAKWVTARQFGIQEDRSTHTPRRSMMAKFLGFRAPDDRG